MKSKILTALLASASLFAGQVENTERDEMIVVGYEAHTSHIPGITEIDIATMWQNFYKEDILNKIQNKANNKMVAIYHDYQDDQSYQLLIGCEVESVDDLPEGLVARTFPKSEYATFEVEGEFPKELINTWAGIWSDEDLIAKRSYTADFEEYALTFTPGQDRLKVFISIH